jgi:hypothetical protein
MNRQRIKYFTATFRRCCRTLALHGLIPPSSTQFDEVAWIWLRNTLYHEFPELRLCSHDWKLQHWLSRHFSSWRSDHVGTKAEVQAAQDGQLGGVKREAPDDNSKLLRYTYAFLHSTAAQWSTGSENKRRRTATTKQSSGKMKAASVTPVSRDENTTDRNSHVASPPTTTSAVLPTKSTSSTTASSSAPTTHGAPQDITSHHPTPAETLGLPATSNPAVVTTPTRQTGGTGRLPAALELPRQPSPQKAPAVPQPRPKVRSLCT